MALTVTTGVRMVEHGAYRFGERPFHHHGRLRAILDLWKASEA